MYKAGMTYGFDKRDLSRAFPESMQIPPLLTSFGRWLADKPWGCVGHYDIGTGWSDRYFAGAEFHYEKFALFLSLPEGSAIGFWLRGSSLTQAPVVLLEAEFEHAVLASSLEEFLARIALGEFPDEFPISELLYQDDEEHQVTDLRTEVQAFLHEEMGIPDIRSLIPRVSPTSTDLLDWIEEEEQQHNEILARHPSMQAIAEILLPYRSEDLGGGVAISFTWAGDFFTATITSGGLNAPLPEAEFLKPHLAVFRNEAAADKPGLGLWHSGFILVVLGDLIFRPDYINRPGFEHGTPPAEAFKADQTRAPRENRRIPPWLAAILAS